jgi:hypothetical protein
MDCASIEFHRAPCFSFRARAFFHCRGLSSSHHARALPRDHAHLRSLARSHDRAERRGRNPGRPGSLFSRHAGSSRLVADRIIVRRLFRKHSRHLDRHGRWPIFNADLDALGTPALPTAIRRVGLLRLLKEQRLATGCRWALMGLLFVADVMNILWIAARTQKPVVCHITPLRLALVVTAALAPD